MGSQHLEYLVVKIILVVTPFPEPRGICAGQWRSGRREGGLDPSLRFCQIYCFSNFSTRFNILSSFGQDQAPLEQ